MWEGSEMCRRGTADGSQLAALVSGLTPRREGAVVASRGGPGGGVWSSLESSAWVTTSGRGSVAEDARRSEGQPVSAGGPGHGPLSLAVAERQRSNGQGRPPGASLARGCRGAAVAPLQGHPAGAPATRSRWPDQPAQAPADGQATPPRQCPPKSCAGASPALPCPCGCVLQSRAHEQGCKV